jgi:hypothetical protein
MNEPDWAGIAPFANPLLFLKINPQSKIGLSPGRVGRTQREVGVPRPLSYAPTPTTGRASEEQGPTIATPPIM